MFYEMVSISHCNSGIPSITIVDNTTSHGI